jgi:hypothetical protein
MCFSGARVSPRPILLDWQVFFTQPLKIVRQHLQLGAALTIDPITRIRLSFWVKKYDVDRAGISGGTGKQSRCADT